MKTLYNLNQFPVLSKTFVIDEIEKPKKIIYDKINTQERNWAFFSENNGIYTFYSINPLRILKLTNEYEKHWTFEDFFEGKKTDSDELSIGTQLSKQNGKYYFVGHKKIITNNKKIYLGKFCDFDFKNKEIKQGKEWLIRSFESLFRSGIKHNTNLLSCTYFSGIQVKDNIVQLGYGINDVDYNFLNFFLGGYYETH